MWERGLYLVAVALLGYLRSFLVPSLFPVCCASADVAADVVGSSIALAAARSTALPRSIEVGDISGPFLTALLCWL